MNKLLISIFALASICSLVSCAKETEPTPFAMGEISLSRERIGTGQTVTATCDLTLNSNSKGIEPEWLYNGSEDDNTTAEYSKNISTYSFEVSSVTNKLECTITYIDDDNSYTVETRDISFSAEISHFYNSFLGDDLSQVMTDNPNITSSSNQSSVYTYTDSESNISYLYRFDSDSKLEQGASSETIYGGEYTASNIFKYIIDENTARIDVSNLTYNIKSNATFPSSDEYIIAASEFITYGEVIGEKADFEEYFSRGDISLQLTTSLSDNSSVKIVYTVSRGDEDNYFELTTTVSW